MAVGAYTAALLGRHLSVPFPLALAAGALVGAALAAPLGLVVFRLRGVYLAIATLAFGEVVRVILLATPITGRGQGLNGIPPKTELWHIYLTLAVVAYALWRVQGSVAGRARSTAPSARARSCSRSSSICRAALRHLRSSARHVASSRWGPPMLLEAIGLAKRFGGVLAVQHVDLAVDAGQAFGLIGPNGAGKTTLVNVISGHLRADAGRIRFAGADVTNFSPDALTTLGIARTFQGVRLFKGLSALDNVLLGRHARMRSDVLRRLWPRGVPDAADRARARA